MAIAKRSMAVEALTPQSAFRDFLKSMDKHRAELLRERDIALHFGDINLAFQCTRDLRQVHEDFLQGPFKADVLKGSFKPTSESWPSISLRTHDCEDGGSRPTGSKERGLRGFRPGYNRP